ncbi:hypothetical protein Dda_3366 [Drechslerella dactyloides]|uniref:Uncharacterized protein n=1 Tax=Drechslerella dactyloides TaxID=74499 RepID=A0AAD6NLP8_DREDA|nr:hypothetical protein Dda_3366 [Drechslerella dactyloides]
MFGGIWDNTYKHIQRTLRPLRAPGVPYSRLGEDDESGPATVEVGPLQHKHAMASLLGNLTRQRRVLLAVLSLAFILLFGYISNLSPDLGTFAISRLPDANDRPLIIYMYHETPNSHRNAAFFLAHGLHDGADFVFVMNGESSLPAEIPFGAHITIIRRNNTCFDLGAYGEVLASNGLAQRYQRFILMNSSIRGPFLPTWSDQCWSDAYLNKVNDTNKLVGMTANCKPWGRSIRPHLQSMILATDRTGISILLNGVISQCFTKHEDAVQGEMNITTAITTAGYTVSAFMTAFSQDAGGYMHHCEHDDVLYEDHYYGMSLHPYETMFQKANRDINPLQLKLLTEWHDRSGYSSQPVCGRGSKGRR